MKFIKTHGEMYKSIIKWKIRQYKNSTTPELTFQEEINTQMTNMSKDLDIQKLLGNVQ